MVSSIYLSLALVPIAAAAVLPLPVPIPLPIPSIPILESIGSYSPKPALCPSRVPLIRAASGLSDSEKEYIAKRKPKAEEALKKWLKKVNPKFSTENLPTLGLTVSGGGYRSLLAGGGFIQGLDDRDADGSGSVTSGLYQAMSYQAGLSGGSWLLSSIFGNDYPTISSLRDKLWSDAFLESLVLAPVLTQSLHFHLILADVLTKAVAGYRPTLTDPWGRALSYQLLHGHGGGIDKTFSGVAEESNFKSHNVPFPIITALGARNNMGECIPGLDATQYEFTPFEFGSWDEGVKAFTITKYLGTSLTGGHPKTPLSCTTNYDNLGYILGTSSHLFNFACLSHEIPPPPASNALQGAFLKLLGTAHTTTTRDLFAAYPNPFYQSSQSPAVSSQKELTLVDGGEASQNNPIWPFIQKARRVDVLIVNDNSADTLSNSPNGSEILTTYTQSLRAGLSSMPEIPSVEIFSSDGLAKGPTAFGCYDNNKITIIWIPNQSFTFQSNISTAKVQFSKAETREMIRNGVFVAGNGNDPKWGVCMGCLIVKKSGGELPAECGECFLKYCYN